MAMTIVMKIGIATTYHENSKSSLFYILE